MLNSFRLILRHSYFLQFTTIPLFSSYLTPTPLLKERGYSTDYLCFTLLLLKEKEMEDEVI
jgi:hypothetical protein